MSLPSPNNVSHLSWAQIDREASSILVQLTGNAKERAMTFRPMQGCSDRSSARLQPRGTRSQQLPLEALFFMSTAEAPSFQEYSG